MCEYLRCCVCGEQCSHACPSERVDVSQPQTLCNAAPRSVLLGDDLAIAEMRGASICVESRRGSQYPLRGGCLWVRCMVWGVRWVWVWGVRCHTRMSRHAQTTMDLLLNGVIFDQQQRTCYASQDSRIYKIMKTTNICKQISGWHRISNMRYSS